MSAENWLKAELDLASKEVASWPEWKREAMKMTRESPSTQETKPTLRSGGADTNLVNTAPEK